MKKILLVGSDGYIGSRFFYENKEIYNISCVDIGIFHNRETTLRINYNLLESKFINSHDCIVFLAGHSSVGMCEGELLPVLKNNFNDFIQFSEKINNDKKFIFISSASVYGKSGNIEVNESYSLLKPINNYDFSKQILEMYSYLIKSKWYSLRLGTVNGWSPNLRTDTMINSMNKSLAEKGFIQISNPNMNRAILSIKELCECISVIINSESKEFGIYNLASFNSTPMGIAKKIQEMTNCKIVESEGNGYSYDFKISCNKFNKDFDFTFKDGIKEIVDDLNQNASITTTHGGRGKYLGYI